MGKTTSTCANCGRRIYTLGDDWLHSSDGSRSCPQRIAEPIDEEKVTDDHCAPPPTACCEPWCPMGSDDLRAPYEEENKHGG